MDRPGQAGGGHTGMDGEKDFFGQLANPRFCERLFAHLPDVVFCLKDRQRRYRAANQAFAARLGMANPSRLIGRTAENFFPAELAETYRSQDEQVLASGMEMADRLELITNRDGSLGWYMATKVPLHDALGKVVGLASISRDLATPSAEDLAIAGVGRVVDHIQRHLADTDLRPATLAVLAGMTPGRLERRMRRIFHLSLAGFVRKSRIGHAAQLLVSGTRPIAEIALACGYGDQSSFTRQFRATVGVPPAAYRVKHRRNHHGKAT